MFLFMMVSLDGYIEGENQDLSWHHVDEEFNDFASSQLQEADTIIMGRKTYQLMESFWPSKQGLEEDPVVAQLMNNTPKLVFSKTLDKVVETKHWKNITLIKNNIVEKIKKIKEKSGKDLIVLGSNNFCVTLLENGLLDELRIMINPVVINKGTPLFIGLNKKINLKLTKTREFKNGNILLYYSP